MTTTIAAQRDQIAAALHAFDFRKLFVEEMGWDRYTGRLAVEVKGNTYTLEGVAEKKGVPVLVCRPDANGSIPNNETRKLIEGQVYKQAHEHLIIFVDRDQRQQFWLWTKREQGKSPRHRGEQYYIGQSGERLIQKLQQIAIDMADEETLSLLDVLLRIEKGFDAERVTKKFYERFQKEHGVFVQAITGIADPELKRWYASLMLNRLMFTYFVQRKGFLDGDVDYLPNRLARVRALGPNKFHSFYRGFLLHLFHDGLGKAVAARQLDPDLARLIGNVPYLNGGLFEVHQIESSNREIAIPDEAFARIFSFFDEYDWYLDDRPLRNDREINPDVLGYIFEKYINQKQMGAYYTKEDITGYIARNTILPFLFDRAREQCRVAFEPGGEVWRLLQDDPDRYIYAAVRQGVDEPLPTEIAAGISDVAARAGWNRPAPAPYALPTETWREHVARRTRCLELRDRLTQGEVTQVNDLTTYNLDIERLAQDVIERCEGPEVLRAFWQALATVTVLDPTCGSGAFLFAALNILKPLYAACLDRMQAFVTDFDRLGGRQNGTDFRMVLERVAQHPKREYFVLKSIIINNLYGVDIMAEACEIAKLRLFLTLVAQVDDVAKLEPLPDIDFNIRAGNTLVGFATLDALRQAMTYDTAGRTRKLLLDPQDEAALASINERAEIVGRAYHQFQQMQSEHGMDAAAFHAAKDELRQRLDALRQELDRYLAREYGISAKDDLFAFAPWRASHQPLHWFVEFYGIVQGRGGFDVIIGNPPYVESHTVKDYKVLHYATQPAGNLYPLVIERSLMLANGQGRVGFIVPVSSISTDGYGSLQQLLAGYSAHASSYNDRPSRLFDGLEHIRLTILIIQKHQGEQRRVYSTECYKWSAVERPHLFARLQYQSVAATYLSYSLPKISRYAERSILDKVWADKRRIEDALRPNGDWSIYYSRKMAAFLQALDFVPEMYDGNGDKRLPSELKELRFASQAEAGGVLCVLNSTLFRWFVNVVSDFRNLNRREVVGMRLDLARILSNSGEELASLARQLSARLRDTSEMREMRFKDTRLRVQCIIPKNAKAIIDEIDQVLARHYGFTDEELDFVLNYDIKYRLGQDNGEDDEE